MHRNPSKPGQAPNDLYNRPLVPLGLTEVSTEPAHYAKWLYILVGVDEGGQSVHCPRRPTFKLRVNVTYRQVEVKDSDGALDGFFSIEDAIDKEERQLLMPLARSLHSSTTLGSTSLSTWQATAALQWHLPERWEQLAIAKAKGWNLQLTIPKKHGAKMHYDYVRMVQLLPVPGVCRELLKQKLQQWDPFASLSLGKPFIILDLACFR